MRGYSSQAKHTPEKLKYGAEELSKSITPKVSKIFRDGWAICGTPKSPQPSKKQFLVLSLAIVLLAGKMS